MKIAIILGTRPEIIKLSPIIRECENQKIDYFIIHTNQHYSENMEKIFFKELKLPNPGYSLNICSGMPGFQIGTMLIEIEKILLKEKPSVVLVQGDTNTVLAGALAASKLSVKIGHVEAGLRSYDRQMPEEINRIIADHISDYLFIPTEETKNNLLREGIPSKKIFFAGNTIADAIKQNIEIASKKEEILEKFNLEKSKYLLLTLHRPSNVDNKSQLAFLLEEIEKASKELNYPVIWPIHPRAKKMLSEFNLRVSERIIITEPLGYFEFLQLQKNARLILSDSGGIQEEACILGVPCITLRKNTERPETLFCQANVLMSDNLLNDCKKILEKKTNWKSPYGGGNSSKIILECLKNVV